MRMFFNSIGSGGSSEPPTPTYDYDIFISAGQSNTDGRNAPPYPSQIDGGLIPNSLMWQDTGSFAPWQLGVNSGADMNTSVNFAFDAIANSIIGEALGKTHLNVKRTKGGTPIAINDSNTKGCWNADFDNIPDGVPRLLEELGAKITAVISYLDSINKTYSFVGLFWHQGESDADLGGDAQNAYYQNFKDVIAYVRGISNTPELPVIFGTIPHVSASYNTTIENAQLQIASEDDNAICIDNKDLTLQDAWHFDNASSELFGINSANAWLSNFNV